MEHQVIEIEQDFDLDGGEIGGGMAVFWSRGHGFDRDEFIRAVVGFCLDNGLTVPPVGWDEKPEELWQQNVPVNGYVEYRRHPEPGPNVRSPRFPVTVLDAERRRHGAQKCAIAGCENGWSHAPQLRIIVEANDPYQAVVVPLCRDHRSAVPDPWYRCVVVPVGSTVALPVKEQTPDKQEAF